MQSKEENMVIVTKDGDKRIVPVSWQNYGLVDVNGKPVTDEKGNWISKPWTDETVEQRMVAQSRIKMHQIVGDHRISGKPCHLGPQNCPFMIKS